MSEGVNRLVTESLRVKPDISRYLSGHVAKLAHDIEINGESYLIGLQYTESPTRDRGLASVLVNS